jgi:hypothetical protein
MKTIKLMADYQCYPLWNMTPGEYGDFEPQKLPISTSLQESLLDWARVYDDTLNINDPLSSGFISVDEMTAFKMQGMRLAEQMRAELEPNFIVLVKINASVRQQME